MHIDFYSAVQARRSYYNLGKESPITDDRIMEIVRHAVKHTPSAFNSQSGRAVVLLGAHHDALWSIVRETLRKIVPPASFGKTEAKIGSFAQGHGTVLFFEDQSAVQSLQTSYPSYSDKFPLWSLQSSGMLQFVVWTALESEGLGASLQHYNPLIDDEVKSRWALPESWRLMSQMPFGQPLAAPGEKEFLPVEGRVLCFPTS